MWLKIFLYLSSVSFVVSVSDVANHNLSKEWIVGIFDWQLSINLSTKAGTYQEFKTWDGVAFRVIAASKSLYHCKLANKQEGNIFF